MPIRITLNHLAHLVFLFFLFQSCSSIFKFNPIIDSDSFDKLKIDTEFILLDSNLNPIPFPEKLNFDKEIKKLQNSKKLFEINNLAVYNAKLAHIVESEKNLKEIIEKNPEEKFFFLNLLRLYFLLDEYEDCQKLTKKFFKKETVNRKKVFYEVLDFLKARNRVKEKVIILDMISVYSEFETKATEELGLYFLKLKDYNQANFYFEKILGTYAYHKIALISMMEIHTYSESWKQVLIFGKSLERDKPSDMKFTNMQSKAYFELGDYENCIRIIEESKDSEKLDLEVFTLWRDANLTLDLNYNPSKLKRLFPILKNKYPFLSEEGFFFNEATNGKKNLQFIYAGY